MSYPWNVEVRRYYGIFIDYLLDMFCVLSASYRVFYGLIVLAHKINKIVKNILHVTI